MPASPRNNKPINQAAENTRRIADEARNTVSEAAFVAQTVTGEAADTGEAIVNETARATRNVGEQAANAGRTAVSEATRTARVMTEQAAEAGQSAAHAGAEIARRNAETVRQAAQSGVTMATQAAQRSASQFARAFGLTGERVQQTTQQSTRNVQVLAETGAVLARGMQDISREWLNFAQDRARKNVESFGALARCRTPQDWFAVQSDLLRDNLEGALNSSRRVAQISMEVADQAARKIAHQAEDNAEQAHKAA